MQRLSYRQTSCVTALLILCLIPIEGCVQTSQIHTEPSGARVTINGAPLGETPIYYSSRAGVPKTYFLELDKPCYKKVEIALESNYRADVSIGLLLPGILPYFFSARLEDGYKYNLLPEDENSKC